MKKKIFAVLLGMTVLLQSSSFTTAAVSTTTTCDESLLSQEFLVENGQNRYCSVNPLYLFCTNEDDKKYAHGSIIRKKFNVESSLDMNDFELFVSSADGVEILETSTYKTDNTGVSTVELAFRVLDSCEIGNICFTLRPLTQSDDEEASQLCIKQNVYCYHESEYDYVSTVCLDCLSDYSEKLKKHLLDIDRQGEYIENEKHFIDATKNAKGTTDYSISVNGYISWTDEEGGIHSAEGVKVELYAVNGTTETYLGTSYTSSGGGYSVSFSSSTINQNVKFKVFSEGTNITVKNASSPYNTYVYESSTFEVWGFAKASYTASNSTNIGQSLSIQQAMALANKYIYSLDSSYLSNINVYYPNSSTSSYYSSGAIYIKSGHQFEWDTLQHEYGHYVEARYNIANSPGGTHYLSANLADSLNNKSAGIRLAWGEGWATYFAINLQKQMSASSLNIPHVGDTHYQDSSNNIDLDMEFLPTNYRKGEANESTVCAVLYDMTDEYNSSEEDNVWFSNGDIWNITKNNHCKTLSEFLTAFYASTFTFSSRLNLGSTLTRYKVSAALNSPTGLDTNTPTFSWLAQGGSTNYPNNSFSLVFYDSNYQLILETNYTTSTSRQLTATEWAKIKNSTSTVYYFVKSRQTNSPVTGDYYSKKMTLYPNQ